MSSVAIPFLDLQTPHLALENELVDAFRHSLKNAAFIGGASVADFEQEFASFCDTKHAVALSSGTDALLFALIASGIKKGDTVVTVPNTFIATTEAITQCGAHIDFVDVDPQSSNMDPQKLKEYIETKCELSNGALICKRTGTSLTGIVPVHLYGQCADMDQILEVAAKYNVKVIEDACQAHGAQYFSRKQNRWLKAGSMGCAAAFSFYPGKNLGAMGEGGAATTNDSSVAGHMKMLRDHGQAQKYFHEIEGYNGRLDAIQCAFLRIKLRHLPRWNEQRRESAVSYGNLLKEIPHMKFPIEPEWSRSVYHLYVVHFNNRDKLQQHLQENGVSTGLHYPLPLHLQKAYRHLGFKKGDFPVSEKLAEELLSLPMFPGLSTEQQSIVANTIKMFW